MSLNKSRKGGKLRAFFNQDAYVGYSLIIISILFIYMSTEFAEEARVFPLIFLIINIVFSVFIIFKSSKRKSFDDDDDEETISLFLLKKPIFLFLGTIVYTLLITWIGFLLSTIIFLLSFIYINKYRSHKVVFLTTILTLVFVYLVFVYELNVPLPSGILFS